MNLYFLILFLKPIITFSFSHPILHKPFFNQIFQPEIIKSPLQQSQSIYKLIFIENRIPVLFLNMIGNYPSFFHFITISSITYTSILSNEDKNKNKYLFYTPFLINFLFIRSFKIFIKTIILLFYTPLYSFLFPFKHAFYSFVVSFILFSSNVPFHFIKLFFTINFFNEIIKDKSDISVLSGCFILSIGIVYQMHFHKSIIISYFLYIFSLLSFIQIQPSSFNDLNSFLNLKSLQ